MATKKKKRAAAIKSKKNKKNIKVIFLSIIIMVIAGFLFVFFVTLFDSIYPPIAKKGISHERKEKQEAALYFSDLNERFLVPEKRYIPKGKDLNDQAKEVVRALIAGSKTGLVNTFPEGTKLQDVRVEKDGTARVSFGKNLVELHPGGSTGELATIYSLTNTLISNIPNVKRVRILIDGKKVTTIKGHIDTTGSFIFDRELIAASKQ
jgi:hypothetical protein